MKQKTVTTPADKAKQLCKRFKNFVATDHKYDDAPIFDLQKVCAEIMVRGIINELNLARRKSKDQGSFNAQLAFWNEVKKELEKL